MRTEWNTKSEPDMYVYSQSAPSLWTVGFYDPSGKWVAESGHGDPDAAADRIAWLNGSKKRDDGAAQREPLAPVPNLTKQELEQSIQNRIDSLEKLAKHSDALSVSEVVALLQQIRKEATELLRNKAQAKRIVLGQLASYLRRENIVDEVDDACDVELMEDAQRELVAEFEKRARGESYSG